MALKPPPCIKHCGKRAELGSSYCAEHKPAAFSTNYRRKRLPNNWGSLRQQVLKRDRYVCYICGTTGADSVDHVINNDDDSLSNLKAVHQNTPPHCHRRKTAMEANRAKQEQKLAARNKNIYERAKKMGLL